LAPGDGTRRDGAEEEEAKEEEAKEVRTTTIGNRDTALGRNARVHEGTRSRSVRSQDREMRSPAGRSARTTTANIARKAAGIAREGADIRETAGIANIEEEADGKEVEGTVAETTREKTFNDGTIAGTIGEIIAETNRGGTIGATIERTTEATIVRDATTMRHDGTTRAAAAAVLEPSLDPSGTRSHATRYSSFTRCATYLSALQRQNAKQQCLDRTSI